MSVKLKKLSEQVVVVTGASSGIGLATAYAAAERGAKVVLAARSRQAIEDAAGHVTAAGGDALAVECDVADRAAVDRLARATVERFGRVDTWVNNAGLGLYGRLEDTPDADARRLFDVNFWGLVNGCLAALPHLKKQGGALINVGSVASESASPVLGMYTTTKHAVKGYTNCLRIELEAENAPVSVTLVEPPGVDTPFPQHARNLCPGEPTLPGSLLDPKAVAEAILSAAETPTRDRPVGGHSMLSVVLSHVLPGVADRLSRGMAGKMTAPEPPRHPEGILYQPSAATGVVGRTHGTGPKVK